MCSHTRKIKIQNDYKKWDIGGAPIEEMIKKSVMMIWTCIKVTEGTNEKSRSHGFNPVKRGRGRKRRILKETNKRDLIMNI